MNNSMVRLERILLATDFSSHSRHAQEYACALAEQFDAELHVLHVLQGLVPLVPETGLMFSPPFETLDSIRQEAEQALNRIPEPGRGGGNAVVRCTGVGAPGVETVRYARESQIDLIVLGTHGRTGLAHVLLGSVAEFVVRHAPCPVLTIRSLEA